MQLQQKWVDGSHNHKKKRVLGAFMRKAEKKVYERTPETAEKVLLLRSLKENAKGDKLTRKKNQGKNEAEEANPY